MHLIDGRSLAQKIRAELKDKIAASGFTPGLGVILAGDDPASHLYVRLKEMACAETGIHFEKYIFPADTAEEKIVEKIQQLNAAPNIHGILVQLPLPSQLDPNRVIIAIAPNKDVDGFHPDNIKLLRDGRPIVEPVLAKAIWRLIEDARKNAGINAKKCLIIGNSDAFIKPLETFLKQKGLMASHIHAQQLDRSVIKQFEIVIIAVGQPNFLKGDDFKDNAIVIDVGINRLPRPDRQAGLSAGQAGGGVICGDVDFESTQNKNGWITPVPGGVGPMTVAILLENVYLLASRMSS